MNAPGVAPFRADAVDGRTTDVASPTAPRWSGMVAEAGRIGVRLAPETAAQLTRYRELLLDWSGRMNLTAVRDPDEIERKLFLDALAMVPLLDRLIDSVTASAGAAVSLVDIGSGAGFPGLVLKIVRPRLAVTLVDATAKKVGFLDAVISDLHLHGIRTVHGRAEALGQEAGFREGFALATARAVAPLQVLLEYVVPLLHVGGFAMLPKGLDLDSELRNGRRAAALLGARVVSAEPSPLPGTRLVLAEKVAVTPRQYPRRIGVPSQHPLPGGG